MKSISQIPASYKQPVNVTLNDMDVDIVARNAILLLVALVSDNREDAADCMIHIWYSVLIRKSDLEILQQRVRPLIQGVCDKIKSKSANTILGKTWSFDNDRSLRLVMKKSSWDSLLSFLRVPEGLTGEQSNRLRTAVTLADSRRDFVDRYMLLWKPSRRIAAMQFRRDGILLPFAARRDDFKEPNP